MSKLKYKLKKQMKKFVSKYYNKKYSEDLYQNAFKKKINWDNPTLFDEKLMYLKVSNYNTNPLIWNTTDKYKMRLFALSNHIKEKHLREIIGVYQNVNEIDYEKLPDKFVISCTHGHDFSIVCNDKKDFDFKKAKRKINHFQRTKFGYETGEIYYTHIKPKIIVEKFDEKNYLFEYKIYAFNGKPKVILVATERDKEIKLNFYDLKWNELMLGKEEYRSKKNIKAPRYLKDMIGISKRLSHDFPFVRIDFHEENGKAVIDGLVFTPAACLASYYNDYGEKYLGDLLSVK